MPPQKVLLLITVIVFKLELFFRVLLLYCGFLLLITIPVTIVDLVLDLAPRTFLAVNASGFTRASPTIE
jgi:hypothetical protein